MTIYGRFSASGNRVMIEQVDQQNRQSIYTLSQGSAMWSENDKTISLALPSLLGVGRAAFYVVDAQGRETSAQQITISTPPVTNVSAANYQGRIWPPNQSSRRSEFRWPQSSRLRRQRLCRPKSPERA